MTIFVKNKLKRNHCCFFMTTHLHTETAIVDLTVSDLSARLNRRDLFANECFATRDVAILTGCQNPTRVDGYLIGFCTAGSARISLNLREYELQPNSFFTAAPKHIVQLLEADPDFAVALLVISSSLFSRMNIDTKQLMPLSIEVADPCVVLHASEAQSLCCYVDRIAAELQGTEQRFTFEMISSLMAATMYKLGNVVCNTIKEQPQILTVGSRAGDYFKQFIRVLSRHYRQERSVTFYAERLNITPKYLTTLIKRVSGRSVSEWVDYYVIVEAKTLLKFSDKSIQEISNELNFANQSFFGSYFRRNVGISPSQYRSKQG